MMGWKRNSFRNGVTTYALKIGFKQMYYTLSGKIPHWSLAMSEVIADHTVI
jgi:sulfide:quinone oxidoreductase